MMKNKPKNKNAALDFFNGSNFNNLFINIGISLSKFANRIKGIMGRNKDDKQLLNEARPKALEMSGLISKEGLNFLDSELEHNISASGGKPLQSDVMEMANHKEAVLADHDFKEEVQKVLNNITSRMDSLSKSMKDSNYTTDDKEILLRGFISNIDSEIDKLNEAIEKLPDGCPYHDLGKGFDDLYNKMEGDQGIKVFIKQFGSKRFSNKGETYKDGYERVSSNILLARGDILNKEPEMEENQHQTNNQDTTPSLSR